MVNIFHILALILCCNRIKEAQEQRKVNELICEEHRIMREWKKKNKDCARKRIYEVKE